MAVGIGNERKDGAGDDASRTPPGQRLTAGFPVLHHGEIPHYEDVTKWNLKVFGLVEEEVEIPYGEFMELPRKEFGNDIHCVTTWSKSIMYGKALQSPQLWRG